MDLDSFRDTVDRLAGDLGIAACGRDLLQLYEYTGLEHGPGLSLQAVGDALYARIRSCFATRDTTVWKKCKSLRTHLIRQHVLLNASLVPYFDVLGRIQDAVRSADNTGSGPIVEDWQGAIRAALDHIQLHGRYELDPERIYAREFNVAKEARHLRDAGFEIEIKDGRFDLAGGAAGSLATTIESIAASIGGVNLARRIFAALEAFYDPVQQRYHVVQRTSMSGGGEPQIPWGYLVQLAAKHVHGRKPYRDTGDQWAQLLRLARAYAAVIDVQPYVPNIWGAMDAHGLLPFLQEQALYDTLFRIPQMRPSDVLNLARGLLGGMDFGAAIPAGCSIDQVLEVVGAILHLARDLRGPVLFEGKDIRRACPSVPRDVVSKILSDVLSHPPAGTNLDFSRPWDASGIDFLQRPLLRLADRQKYILLDQSVCAPAFIEALFTQLRACTANFDSLVGNAAERFLEGEFAAHGVSVCAGEYDTSGTHGECDLVVETSDVVILLEMKKKVLTRKARGGSDIDLLVDLADSLLAAQVQAGRHEIRLRMDGRLDLRRDGRSTSLELHSRSVERIAVSILDYGSLQDRVMLKRFLEAAMYATFTPVNESRREKIEKVNAALVEVRGQVASLNPGDAPASQPFFHCWFISIPQILVLLDGVTDGDSFKGALWRCRAIVTGSSDLYHDLARMRGFSHQITQQPAV